MARIDFVREKTIKYLTNIKNYDMVQLWQN